MDRPETRSDGWKAVADKLNAAADKLEPSGSKPGITTIRPSGKRWTASVRWIFWPRTRSPTVMLQLDVGTCLEGGADPVAWIQANPGRIRSIHCKDWSPDPAWATRLYSARGWPTGKAFSRLPRASAESSITWSNRREAGSPSWRRRSECLQHFDATYAARLEWSGMRSLLLILLLALSAEQCGAGRRVRPSEFAASGAGFVILIGASGHAAHARS